MDCTLLSYHSLTPSFSTYDVSLSLLHAGCILILNCQPSCTVYCATGGRLDDNSCSLYFWFWMVNSAISSSPQHHLPMQAR